MDLFVLNAMISCTSVYEDCTNVSTKPAALERHFCGRKVYGSVEGKPRLIRLGSRGHGVVGRADRDLQSKVLKVAPKAIHVGLKEMQFADDPKIAFSWFCRCLVVVQHHGHESAIEKLVLARDSGRRYFARCCVHNASLGMLNQL